MCNPQFKVWVGIPSIGVAAAPSNSGPVIVTDHNGPISQIRDHTRSGFNCLLNPSFKFNEYTKQPQALKIHKWMPTRKSY